MKAVAPFFLVAALLAPAQATAVGFGGYLQYLHGDGYFRDDGESRDQYNNGFALGFAFDTNVAKDFLFNYRLTTGFRYATGENEFDRLDDYDTYGWVMEHSFGFRVWNDERMRVWAGPAFGWELDERDAEFTNHDAFEGRIGFGTDLGVNVHTGRRVSIGLRASYRYVFGLGTQTDEDFTDDDDCPEDDEAQPTLCLDLGLPNYNSYRIREHVVGVSLSIFFRTEGDVYQRKGALARRAEARSPRPRTP